jgi:hypothetical protein
VASKTKRRFWKFCLQRQGDGGFSTSSSPWPVFVAAVAAIGCRPVNSTNLCGTNACSCVSVPDLRDADREATEKTIKLPYVHLAFPFNVAFFLKSASIVGEMKGVTARFEIQNGRAEPAAHRPFGVLSSTAKAQNKHKQFSGLSSRTRNPCLRFIVWV